MIKFVKSAPKLVKFGFLGLLLIGLDAKEIQAQRSQQEPTSMLSLDCTSSGYGTLDTDNLQNISIGRQIFTPIFKLFYISQNTAPYLLTCKLTPNEQSKTLQLEFGIEDYAEDDAHEAIVTVYLDGQPTSSLGVSAGEGKTILVDVTKTNSLAMEAVCRGSSSCPTINFFKADILPSPTSSYTDSNSTVFDNSNNSQQNKNPQPAQPSPPPQESAWGDSTVGEEAETTKPNPSGGGSIKNTIEDVNTIIDIFK